MVAVWTGQRKREREIEDHIWMGMKELMLVWQKLRDLNTRTSSATELAGKYWANHFTFLGLSFIGFKTRCLRKIISEVL